MTLNELIEQASKGYPDKFLTECFHNGEVVRGTGDTLAEFIVIELKETFDAEANLRQQKRDAVRALERAIENLQDTINAIEEL